MAESTAKLFSSAQSRDPSIIGPSPLPVSIDLSSTDWVAGEYLVRFFSTSEDGTLQIVGASAPPGDPGVPLYCVKGVPYPYVIRRIIKAGCSANLQAAGKVTGGQ